MLSTPENPITELLTGAVATLDIPPELRVAATLEYGQVGNWLADHADHNGQGWKIYPQGSFLLGTVVRPFGLDEYDVDVVCERSITKDQTTQSALKSEVGDALRRYVRARLGQDGAPMDIEERMRCWTLLYLLAFHLDVLPAIPCPDGSPTGILLTDRHLREWQFSDPIAYGKWFRARMETELVAKRMVLAEARRVQPAAIPDAAIKTTLQLVVQLLKLHRNIYFADQLDSRPASILLTTLATHAYDGERDVYDALVEIVDEMPRLVTHTADGWVVSNPVEPRENFADKWSKDPALARQFFDWMERISLDLREAAEQHGLYRVTTRLAESFGEEPIQKAAKRLGDGYREASAAGLMMLGATTGRLSGSGSIPVKRHGFYGATRPAR